MQTSFVRQSLFRVQRVRLVGQPVSGCSMQTRAGPCRKMPHRHPNSPGPHVVIGSGLKQKERTPAFRQVRSYFVAVNVWASPSRRVACPAIAAPATPARVPRKRRRDGALCIALAMTSNCEPSMTWFLLNGLARLPQCEKQSPSSLPVAPPLDATSMSNRVQASLLPMRTFAFLRRAADRSTNGNGDPMGRSICPSPTNESGIGP